MEHATHPERKNVLKKVYLYAVSLISLIMIIVACVSLINLGLKAFVFTKSDYNSYAYCAPTPDGKTDQCDELQQKQDQHDNLIASRETETSRDLALLIVGIPVFWYHWRLVRKETD